MLPVSKTPWWALALAVFVAGCGDNDGDPAGPDHDEGHGTVVIQFDHVVGGSALAFDAKSYRNAAGNDYSVSTLMYFVSELKLHEPAGAGARDGGGHFEADVVHFRDGRDDATRSITLDEVPAGNYEALEFRFGLDDHENVGGSMPEYDADMEWPMMMGGGYHYMKLEGNWGTSDAFLIHTGRNRDAAGTLVDHSFPVEVDLEPAGGLRHGSIEVHAGETTTIHVIMDLNEWYETPTVWDFADHDMIMMDYDAQVTLKQNGSTVFSALPVE